MRPGSCYSHLFGPLWRWHTSGVYSRLGPTSSGSTISNWKTCWNSFWLAEQATRRLSSWIDRSLAGRQCDWAPSMVDVLLGKGVWLENCCFYHEHPGHSGCTPRSLWLPELVWANWASKTRNEQYHFDMISCWLPVDWRSVLLVSLCFCLCKCVWIWIPGWCRRTWCRVTWVSKSGGLFWGVPWVKHVLTPSSIMRPLRIMPTWSAMAASDM